MRPVLAATVGLRAHDACLGVQTIMGGDNPWGSTLYHLCRSSTALPAGVLDMFLLMFVDVPLVKCMCKDSQGHRMEVYALQHCVPRAPPSLRPTLLGMISAARRLNNPELLCPAVIAYTRKTLKGTMETYFSSMDLMMEALGGSVDYALVGFDASAGQCENFAQDPQVVVIMPQPIAYFQACGMTSSCQSKCLGPWTAFSEALARFDPASLRTSREIQQTAESLFFPTPGADIIASGTVVALLQLDGCDAAACNVGPHDCIAAAMSGSAALSVERFCVPMDPAASVHPMVGTGSNWQSTFGNDALQVAFFGATGEALLVLVPQADGNVIYLLSPTLPPVEVLGAAQGIQALLLLDQYPLNVVSFRVIGEHVLAGVAVRKTVDGKFQSGISYVWFTPGVSTPSAGVGVVDFPENLLSGYVASEYPSEPGGGDAMRQSVLLLWPTQATGGPLRLTVQYSNQTLQMLALDAYQLEQSLVAKASFMPRNIVLARGLRVSAGALEVYASTGRQYDWLQMLRVTGSDLVLQAASLRNSRSVPTTINVQTGCDGTDCRGCTDLALRALCAQYQQCSIVRCIGTPVNLKRPLCDVGGVLSTTGQMALEMTRGGWLVFVDVFMAVLELSTRQDVRGVSLSAPEDAFFGQICAAKDLTAELSGVIMSTVNSALQLVQVPVPILQESAKLDANANTILSLTTAALTGFFHQAGLLPIYVLAVAHKIMMCQVQGYVSLVSTAGFRIELVPANLLSASDAVSGQCLAQSTQVDAMQTGDAANTRSTGARVATLLAGSSQQAVLRRLDPLIHIFDGGLTYLIGVLGSFANVLQTLDLQNCLVPDVTLQYAMQCACGDQPMAITPQRRAEGVPDFAYWCSGTVSVIDAQNLVQVVHNPYSYQELQTLIGGLLDQYLQCTARSNSCVPPNLPVFQQQGVNAIQVLTRCRQNYVNRQWDQAAFVQYDARAIAVEIRGPTHPPALDEGDGVGACLVDSAARGETNGACLDAFLLMREHDPRYWAYEQLASNSSVLIDACMVFSGPASKSLGRPNVTTLFRNCLNIYSEGNTQRGCDLSGHVWSPSSSNTVPVAQLHVVGASAGMIASSVEMRMQLAFNTVMEAVHPLLDYDNSELRADFFSSEGDVIHQLLDCVFMGPYARMDYWPAPVCNESQTGSCLVGPYWSRDEGRGASRGVDIQACAATPTLPFTCGSPSRKAMVREFVKVYVEQGRAGSRVFIDLVRAWLNHTFYEWQDVASYGCECPPGSAAPNAPGCCNGTADVYLPAKLQDEGLQLPSNSVINALEQRMQRFYDDALNDGALWTTWLTDEELAKYDGWTNAEQEGQVRAEALFDASAATMSYSSAEAMRPPNRSGGVWLWDQCHGALRQVFFTVPVTPDGALRDGQHAFNGGGVEAISAYVEQTMQAAFADSPLYRHYQVRHHPSNSTVCRQRSEDPPGGRILFDDYTVGSIQMALGAGYQPVSSLGFRAGYLGRANHSCFCGWTLRNDRCIVPDAVCPRVKELTSATTCYFPVDAQPFAALSDAFQPGVWPCPYLDLTDHLGFLDPGQIDAWVAGGVDLTTSLEYVLRHGPGGLKAGNIPRKSPVDVSVESIPLADLRKTLRLNMHPGSRKVDPATAVLEGCEESARLQAASLVDDFVERLFPMAQGVEESGVGAYCLRFAMELSRLKALELIQSENHTAMVLQKDVVLEWRRKCGTQARLIGMCQALQIYKPLGLNMHMCPQETLWQIAPESGHVIYVTPQCLVHIDGVFYDPCTCNPNWCLRRDNGVVHLTRAMLQATECGLRFDPRSVVQPAEMGRWARDDARPGAQEWNAWQQDSWNLLDLDGLMASMMGQGQAAGNTPAGQHWATAEGFMNDTGLFCDMISDYWPDQGVFPVGYHVSVPCDSSETGYRSFDNVFAQDIDQGEPCLVYLEDETRDRGWVDSHLGSSGICRLTNFGFDMYETNTMRTCTRVRDNEDVDIHVPRTDNPPGDLGLDRCSVSSTEVPWDDALLFTVGNVPNLPTPSDVRYPSRPEMLMRLGPQARLAREGWGASCQDFQIPNCSAGWACPAGFRCMAGGVCQDQAVQCVQHADCTGGAMCTGMGRCTRPRVTLVNKMARNISFMAHTSRCSGEAFSMRGVSPWGYVPDLLHAHGMCSYRHWQEYLYTRANCRCTGDTPCTVEGQSCSFRLFDEPNDENMWWDPANHFPNRLKMLPTTCDRDYQRFEWDGVEMKGCAAAQGRYRLVGPGQDVLGTTPRDTAWRTYDQDTRRVSVAAMPFLSSASYGFLGFQDNPNIQSCTRVQQCFCDTYTRNGTVSMYTDKILRPKRTSPLNKMYEPNDFFQCGAVGYLDQGRCKLDTRVLPLYRLLCVPGNTPYVAVKAACAPVLKTNIQQLCSAVPEQYEMKYSYIHDIVVPSLTALFYAFNPATNLVEHMNLVQCMSTIYEQIKVGPFESRGLYFPFTFTLYEFPFAWFYQCMVQGTVAPTQDLSRVLYPCYNYEKPSSRALGVYGQSGDSFVSFVSRVRGGYDKATVKSQTDQQYAQVAKVWSTCVQSTQKKFYGSKDSSYPVCQTERRWNLGSTDYYTRRAIGTYVRPTCASNVRLRMLQFINSNKSLNINVMDLENYLTTVQGQTVAQSSKVQQSPILGDKILNFGLSVLKRKALPENLRTDATDSTTPPLVYDATLPGVKDMEYTNARDQLWKSFYQPNPTDIYVGSHPLEDCATQERQRLFTDSEEPDRNDVVRVCPVNGRGSFSCHLDTITQGTKTYTYTGKDPDTVYADYVDVLYGNTLTCFDQAMANGKAKPQALQPNATNFFVDEANLAFTDLFQFDLTRVSGYMVNIQPDINVPVMCAANTQVTDYTNCTNANYNTLGDHVRSQFTVQTGRVVPPQYQMDWEVTSDMMETGAIFSFAEVDRNVSKQYMGFLFDQAHTCTGTSLQGKRLDPMDRMCTFTSTGALTSGAYVSPWLSGEWNPFDKCDVDTAGPTDGFVETVNIECSYPGYCVGSSGTPFDQTMPYYANMPYLSTCKAKNGLKTTQLNVDASTPYNLCKHSLIEDTVCLHMQGMLGGTDGFPMEDYSVDPDMYSLHDFTAVPQGDGALFGNVLLAGRNADYGFVRFPSSHIGGHHLVMTLTDGLLRVQYLPLKEVDPHQYLANLGLTDVRDWVTVWQEGMQADHLAYISNVYDKAFVQGYDAREQPNFGWDCPIRRRAFYGGNVKGFEPYLPSARRSQRIFGDLTGARFANPVQRRARATEFGEYRTSNGFCFCPVSLGIDPTLCEILVTDMEHDCSLFRTIAAVQGLRWGSSHTFLTQGRGTTTVASSGPTRCGVQLDWPFVKGSLRDNQTVMDSDVEEAWAGASSLEEQKCHVLDRLAEFDYIFVSKNELKPSGVSTLEGGVCHTGRVQDWRRLQSGARCLRTAKDAGTANVTCSDGAAFTRARRRSARPFSQVSNRYYGRFTCGRCTPPPRFQTKAGTPMEPESSFGLPFRLSAERLVADDLLEAICAEDPACRAKLNLTAWQTGEFLRAYVGSPASLFEASALSSLFNESSRLTPRPAPDDSALWADPWVYCPSREGLLSGENCTGSIGKREWRADKVGTCHRAVNFALDGRADPMAKTDVCNLDPRLSALCQALEKGRSLVASANCLASGNPRCMMQEFMYTPSTWETTNQEFVHDTVTKFYRLSDPQCLTDTVDCVCPVDPALATFMEDKQFRLQQCSAVSVVVVQQMLVFIRGLGNQICVAFSYLISMLLDMMLTFSTAGGVQGRQQLMLNWAEFKRLAGGVIDGVSDLAVDLVFQSGVAGPWLRGQVYQACGVINQAYKYFADFWCGFIVTQLPMFLGSLKSVGFWIETGFSVVNDVFQTILRNYLPDAMMELYQKGYNSYFASNQYNEKTAAYEKKKQLDLKNPKQGKPLSVQEKNLKNVINQPKVMKNLGEAQAKSITSSTLNTADKLFGPVAMVAGLINAGIGIYQGIEDLERLQKLAAMAEKFPASLTLFDFTSFYQSIDAIVTYIDNDLTCYSVIPGTDAMHCDQLVMPSPRSTDVGQMAPVATTCWADAQQQQVGVSTLYSCSATSTCCVDPLCESTMLCASCPVQTAPGYRDFGCNTVVQRCQCGVQSVIVSRCTSHSDCAPASACSLLTSLEDVSFGSLAQCSLCSVQPVCLMGKSPQSGTCTCLTTGDLEVDRCGSGAGTAVMPHSAHLCGFSRTSGAYFSWAELALALCANVNAPVCSEVTTESNGLMYMPVATSLKGLGFSSRRRLLAAGDLEEEPGFPAVFAAQAPAEDITPAVLHAFLSNTSWNQTAAPCSSLAHAYARGERMGPTDEAALQSCVYWRRVGQRLIQEYNLTSMRGADSFLLSPDDLAWALGQAGVAEELTQKPWVWVSAAMYSPWLKPARAWSRAVYGPNISRMVRGFMQDRGVRAEPRRRRSTVPQGSPRKPTRRPEDDREPSSTPPARAPSNRTGAPHRKLQGVFEETDERLQALPYYAYVQRMNKSLVARSVVASISQAVSQSWVRGAFSWRPFDFGSQCAPADTLVASTTQVLGVLRTYYGRFDELNRDRKVSTRLGDSLPRFTAPNVSFSDDDVRLDGVSLWSLQGLGAYVLNAALRATGASVGAIVQFLNDPCDGKSCVESNRWTLTYMVDSLSFCDFEALMYCSNYRRGLAVSFAMAVMVYWGVSFALKSTGADFVSPWLFYAIPVMTLWLSMGVSFTCLPMLPTCLLDDLVIGLEELVPLQASIPPALIVGNGTALRACDELGFGGWTDSLAFLLCDAGLCGTGAGFVLPGFIYVDWGAIQGMLGSREADAYRWCAFLSMGNGLWIFLIVPALFGLVCAAAYFVTVLMPQTLALMWYVVVYNHAA